MDERIYNPEIEIAALAHVLRHPEDYAAMADVIRPESFGWHAFGWVWEAMGTLHAEGLHIDALTVGDALERSGRLGEFQLPDNKTFTDRAALGQLRDTPTTKGGGLTYASHVADYAALRMLDEWTTTAHGHAHGGRTAAAIVSDLTTKLSTLSLPSMAAQRTNGMETLTVRAKGETAAAVGGVRDLNTGLVDLDRTLRIRRKEFIVIAGRPGQGKSSLLDTILVNAAKDGKHGLLFSCEMGDTQVTQRMIAQLSGLDGEKIQDGALEPGEWDTFYAASDKLAELPITICDKSAIRVSQVRAETRKIRPDFVAVDYVQLMRPDGKYNNRVLELTEITQGLKELAMELDIPVLAAAQLSRAPEQRSKEDRRPVLSDLRESGSLENDADSVVGIYNQDDYSKTAGGLAELIILKHRNGRVGTVTAYFHKPTTEFRNATHREIDLRTPYPND